MKKIKTETLFLLIYLPLSFLMMLAMPVTRVPDEDVHLIQSFLIADGQLISALETKEVSLPENIDLPNGGAEFSRQDLAEAAGVYLSESRIVRETQTSTAIYPPICYLPQALGMYICMLFTNHLLAILYSARVMNWLCTAAVLYAAIRMLPSHKMMFLFLSILPLNLQQMISASADGMTAALVYALMAFVLHCCEKKPSFTWKHVCVMGILALGVCCWKVFYAPMIFLLLFIPAECFGSQKKKSVREGYVIGGALVLLLLWLAVCYSSLFRNAVAGPEGQTMKGMTVFLAQPGNFLIKLFRDLKSNFLTYLYGVFGYSAGLSWFNVSPGSVLSLGSAVCFVLFCFADDTEKCSGRCRICAAALSAMCVLLVFFMLYLWWTPADSLRIDGFQARYILPLLFPLTVAAGWKPRRRIFNRAILLALAVIVDLGYIYQIFQQI